MPHRIEKGREQKAKGQSTRTSKAKGGITPAQKQIIRDVIERRKNLYRELAKH